MVTLKRNIWLNVIFIPLLALGCSEPAEALATTINATTVSLPANILPATNAPATAGMLADTGERVFAVYCSGCHGIHGVNGFGGVTLIGPGSGLSQYGTVKDLSVFLSQGRPFAMPYENPGNITSEQLDQITAYLVVQNEFISPATIWENLPSLLLLDPG
jgi:mono/diheme cytochrome c family protein